MIFESSESLDETTETIWLKFEDFDLKLEISILVKKITIKLLLMGLTKRSKWVDQHKFTVMV